jgi:hypothetical protein
MSLLLPVPTNLLLPGGTKSFVVSDDLYDICSRIREEIDGGNRLFVVLHEEPNGTQYYTIMERSDDGVERVAIPRVEELDGRVLERLRYILSVPLEKRLAELERLESIAEDKAVDDELEELYDRMGRPMLTQLEHDGFIQRSTSYAKAGVASRGKRAR